MSDPQPPLDFQKWVHELRRHDAHREHDRLENFFNSVNSASIKAGELTLRMAMLINGGAAVAMLAFIGGLISKDKIGVGQLERVGSSLTWFAGGVAFAVAGVALSYFTNFFLASVASSQIKKWEPPYLEPGANTFLYRLLNKAFHIATVIAGLVSLALFVGGILSVRTSLVHLA